MPTTITIDTAGGQAGGMARIREELVGYLQRHTRHDVKVIGADRYLNVAWLAAREASAVRRSRRIALNNVGFITPGGERWTLLTNAVHFLTAAEMSAAHPQVRAEAARQGAIVRRTARRSDVVIAPCTAMAERITAVLPDVADRLVMRMHPISSTRAPQATGSLVLCPVLFSPYKRMPERIADWVAAADGAVDDSVRLIVTASAAEMPASLAASPRLHLVGRLSVRQVADLWHRCRAVYFPPTLESFGYPLAEARVHGRPVIAVDTPQHREIAGGALCGYTLGDRDSLRCAINAALTTEVEADPSPFDPDTYFDWMLGKGR